MCALTRSHVCHEQDLLKSWVDTNRARIKGIEIPRKEDVIGDEIIFPREKEEEWSRDTTAKSAVIIFNDSPIPSGHEENLLAAENTRALAELDANVQKLRETYKNPPIHMFRMHFTAENKKMSGTPPMLKWRKSGTAYTHKIRQAHCSTPPRTPALRPHPCAERECTHTHTYA